MAVNKKEIIGAGNDELEDVGVQVRVNFVLDPSIKDRSLKVSDEAIAVPASIRRAGLSAVINHLLDRKVNDDDDEDEDDEEKGPYLPFEFVINNKILRTGVESAARRYGMSLEQSIPITYFPAQQAPDEEGKSEPNPEWISSLSFQEGTLFSGGYDGFIHVHDVGSKELKTVTSSRAHFGPIKCLATSNYDRGLLIATGSLDQSLIVHKYNAKSKTIAKHSTLAEGHTSSISCIDIREKSHRMASADWDGNLCVWDLGDSSEDAHQETTAKRIKSSSSTSRAASTTKKPIASMHAHVSQISGVSWLPENDAVVTGSWDHSVRVWNVEKQETAVTLNGSRVVSCLSLSPHSEVVATGHPDCTIRLWDIRTKGTESSNLVSDSSLKPSHKAWVSAIQWSPKSPFLLASGSHDGTLKIWDIRSSLPLHTTRTQPKDEKNLCLVHGDHDIIYTGGTDCRVKQYKL